MGGAHVIDRGIGGFVGARLCAPMSFFLFCKVLVDSLALGCAKSGVSIQKPLPESKPQISLVSSWLTGLILLVMLVIVVSIVSAAVQVPHAGIGQGDNPNLILPEGSSMLGTRNQDASETVEGTPADTGFMSIDSKPEKPDTDKLPGR